MGKLVVSEFVSLDGVMEGPGAEDGFEKAGWTMRHVNEQFIRFKHDELFAADALLLGRITYEGFAAAWPGRTDDMGFAQRMNSLPKYVVSATLKRAKWENCHIIHELLAETVTELTRKYEKDVLVLGSGQLVQALMEQGLVDEYRLLVYPVVLGEGKRIFKAGATAALRLVDCEAFKTGVVRLNYKPAE